MISTKKLIKIARQWKKRASIGRTRVSFPRDVVHCKENSSPLTDKGHFVIYTTDHTRFSPPLAYLRSKIFQGLFRMSEEEFGLPSEGPIRMPFNSVFMEYIIAAVHRGLARDVEKVLLGLLPDNSCSSAGFHKQHTGRQLIVCVN